MRLFEGFLYGLAAALRVCLGLWAGVIWAFRAICDGLARVCPQSLLSGSYEVGFSFFGAFFLSLYI